MIPLLWTEPYNEQIWTKNKQVSVKNNLDSIKSQEVGVNLLHRDGKTNRHDDAIVDFATASKRA